MGSSQQISIIETLEARTMMSTAALPVVETAAKVSAVDAHLVHMTPIKTVNPALTDKTITYRSFSSDPLFASNGPTMSDVNQGYLGDCYLLSTLSSIVKTDPTLIKKNIVSDGNGIYTVLFGGAKPTAVNVNADLPVWPDGQLAYAQLGNENRLWVAIYEKAFAEYQNPKANSYASINGGWMSEAFGAFGLQSQTATNFSSSQALAVTLQADLKAGDFTTFGTQSTLPTSSPLVAGHAYEVDSVTDNANGTPVSITLRNPWGAGAADDGMITITAAQAFSAFCGVVISHA